MKKAFPIVLFLSLFVFCLSVPFSIAGEAQKTPDFSIQSLSGSSITQKALEGKVTLLVFWASWCGTCQHELPQIQKLHRSLENTAFQVIAVGFKDSKRNIEAYVKQHADVFPYPVYYDSKDQMSARFGARVTPTLFLIDKTGSVVVSYQGGGMLDHPRFEETLKPLL